MSEINQFAEIRKLIEKSDYTKAIAELDKIIGSEKNNYDAYILKAGALQLIFKEDETAKLYEYIINVFPDNPEAYIELISLYNVQLKKAPNSQKKIIQLCEQLEKISESKTPYHILAKTYDDLDETELALEAYEEAIKQQAIHIRVTSMFLTQKKFAQDAREYAINEIAERRVILYDALTGKADCLRQRGETQKAIDTYKIAIDINIFRKRENESYDEYEKIAKIYEFELDNPKTAKFYYDKAERLEKLNTDAYDIEQGRMTEDEFNEWFDSYFKVDENGKIIGIKKPNGK